MQALGDKHSYAIKTKIFFSQWTRSWCTMWNVDVCIMRLCVMIQGNSLDENEDCKKNVFTKASSDNSTLSGLV